MKKVLILVVFALAFTGCTETQLCLPSLDHDSIKVKKCTQNGITLYQKIQDSSTVTDTSITSYYDGYGNKICAYNPFNVHNINYCSLYEYEIGEECPFDEEAKPEPPCVKELREWNENFDKTGCQWQDVCRSGMFAKN